MIWGITTIGTSVTASSSDPTVGRMMSVKAQARRNLQDATIGWLSPRLLFGSEERMVLESQPR